MKYNIMLIDDESISLKGLQRLIDWEKLDCEVVATAFSAIDALDVINDFNLDIIITDLVMPEMDGLELISLLSKTHPNIEVIILSGHGEFEYAQQAIKNNVCEFLVKPATEKQLEETINKVCAKIDKRKKREALYLQQEELLNKSMPLLKNQYMLDIVKSNMLSIDEIENRCSIIGFKFYKSSVIAKIIISSPEDPKSELMIKLSVKNLCENYMNDIKQVCILIDDDSITILLSDDPDIINEEKAYSLFERLWKEIKSKFDNNLSIGVGKCFSRPEAAFISYKGAHNAVKSRFFIGNNQIVHHSIAIENSLNGLYPFIKSNEIIDKIKYEKECNSAGLANELIEDFITASGYNIDEIYDYCRHFCMKLLDVLQTSTSVTEDNKELTYFLNINNDIKKNTTVKELKKYMAGIIKYEINIIDTARNEKNKSIISKAKEYIINNMSGDLSLNAIAKIVFMNPIYFSSVFKHSAGTTYQDYIFGEKMKLAKKMLIEKEKMIYEISESVGYINARSFSDAFKRYYGVTPSNYIKQFHENRS